MKQCFISIRASMRGLLLSFLVLVPVAASAGVNISSTPLSSLEQIEPLVRNGPEVLAALSASARDEELEALEWQRTGASYFGGITYGHSSEPLFSGSEEKSISNKLTVTGGLNFPLLGTLQKEKLGKLALQTTTLKSKHYANMLSLNKLTALRKAYTALWIEQQKEELSNRFLATETETVHILQERQAQGLVLPVDKLEFLAVYYDVRRDLVASKLRQTEALNVIGLATGRKWDMANKLKAPSLPSIDGKKIDLNSYPEFVFQNNLIAQYEKLFAEKKRLDREANLTIGLTATRDFPGATGNGAYITFSMMEPLQKISSKHQAQLTAADDLSRAKKEALFTHLKLEGQVAEALAAAAYAAADVNARTSHLIVMAESMREKMLRRMVLPGDTFEQLQHSKSAYYRTMLDMLDHEENFLQSVIDLIPYIHPTALALESTERILHINERDGVRTKLLTPNWLDTKNIQDDLSVPFDFSVFPNLKVPVVTLGSVDKTTEGLLERRSTIPSQKVKAAIYVWNAEPFLKRDTGTAALNEIIHAGFSRMLISFTPTQILSLSSSKGKNELTALITDAHSKGVRIDLMLGDPAWVQEEQREALLALIQQLNHFAFDGIHLDIEPDSLPGASERQAELLEGLADTISAVKEITLLPVSISIHPRYLEGDLGTLARQKLLPLGLEEVVVMIYSDNSHATAQRMSAIITSNPDITFSLAQSVEKDIPLAESYGDSSPQDFKETMHILADSLAIYGLNGLFIQAWEDYKKGEHNEGILFIN